MNFFNNYIIECSRPKLSRSMKFSALLFLVASTPAAMATRPLVSVAAVTELASDSFTLTYDLIRFSSIKIEESLSGEPRTIYSEFTKKCVAYKAMVVDYWTAHPAVGDSVKGITAIAYEQYATLNILSARILDPLMKEFEEKCPSSKGMIGSGLADRLLLATYLIWFVRFVLSVISALLFGRRRSRFAKSVAKNIE